MKIEPLVLKNNGRIGAQSMRRPEHSPCRVLWFLGVTDSGPQVLGYGYDFERATHAIVLPKHLTWPASDESGVTSRRAEAL